MAGNAKGKHRILVLVMVSTYLVSCAGTGAYSPEELSPAQLELRERASKFNQTIWQGALIGGVVGTLIGVLVSQDRAKGALIGGLAGAAAGGLAGGYIASKQEQYADHEDQLEAMITDVKQKNQEATALIDSMKVVVAEDLRRLDALNEQFDQQAISQTEYDRQLAIVRADRDEISQAIGSAEEQLATFKEAKELYEQQNAEVATTQLATEIKLFQASINTMDGIVSDLSAADLG